MNISNHKQFPEDPILGESPDIFFGVDVPDGDASPWKDKPVGSVYFYRDDTNGIVREYTKRKADDTDNDWVIGLHVITETIALADFTDGGGAAGTYDLAEQIPVGGFALRSTIVNLTGFSGNTSATIQVGDGSDVDRYSNGTPSVFASANAVDLGAPSGTQIHVTAATPRVTITAGSDWGAVAAGKLTLRIYYLA